MNRRAPPGENWLVTRDTIEIHGVVPWHLAQLSPEDPPRATCSRSSFPRLQAGHLAGPGKLPSVSRSAPRLPWGA